MKAQRFATAIVASVILFAIAFSACKKDEDNPDMNVSSVTVAGKDIASGTATGVDISANIIANFSDDVSPTTANSTNIVLTNTTTNANVSLTFTVTGSTITIAHSSVLDQNTRYTLKLQGIESLENVSIDATTISFTTAS